MPPPHIGVPIALLMAAAAIVLVCAAAVFLARSRGSTRRLPVDDAYTIWLDAHSRCDQALRAWNAAGPAARRYAYRKYLAELQREEEAARRLEQLQLTAAPA
jgi:hypothetical protein